MTAARTSDYSLIQRASPFGPTEPKQKILLRFEQIHPIVRIAHLHDTTLTIPERIIYDHELVLVARGAMSLTMNGQARLAEPGTLLLIPPFTPHSFHTPTGITNAHFAVHFDFSPDARPSVDRPDGREPYEIVWPGGAQPPTFTALAPGHWVEQTLREIVDRHADEDDPLSAIETSCRLARVLTQLLRWGARAEAGDALGVAGRVNHERVARVLAHIAANLGDPLTLEELARVADVSRSRLVTLFREATGESPQQYIQGKRIAEARRLLADPSLQIKQIAAMTGFEDRFYFSKVFRRVDGLTPTQFRAAVLFGRSHSPEDEFSS
ncbi:MAG: AraC family transcriptional regulator [Capsulimonas sp.]|uniref:AraC family transcriptional regulator n=1 Tax=Capsulimonas sp. TaxID=2494211 RepID=UPI003264A933